MAASSVTVLCPNGRRVIVKVTPNSSILQIIEDACGKEKFDPDHYNLKHLRRLLDISSTVRYSGLPNKCQLELVKIDVPRTAKNVVVNIATDSGLRLTHEFPATTTLWEILSYHEQCGEAGSLLPPPESDLEPVIVYTMRRVRAEEIKTTTLKALGIPSGKCMLRYSVQSASSNSQAHVSAPLARPKTSQYDALHENTRVEPRAVSPQPSPQVEPRPRTQPLARPRLPPPPHEQLPQHPVDLVPKQSPDLVSSSQSVVPDVVQLQNTLPQPDVTDGQERMEASVPMDLIEGHSVPSSSSFTTDPQPSPVFTQEKVIIKLDSNDAILFSVEDAPPTLIAEEDDSFFELSANEVKNLYHDQQKELQELSEAPMMTQEMRKMEESARILSALNKYPVTRLRVYFPDGHIIQASFKPMDTVGVVMNFLRPFLADPSLEFNLHTRHPPKVLSADTSLVAADCVPNARLYFGCSGGGPYLSDDTIAKKSSFVGACSTVIQTRPDRQISSASSSEYPEVVSSTQVSTSTERSDGSVYNKRTNRTTGAVPKLPKWFKTGK
ncbi:tether containing UBX domain for GLUT4-like isoform X2 [Homarus americanus]|uniref:tether containing UBX domain for GLUT4-like isoform X2 n=1 Tax=Homarus americanus TaxID=6706 RepID=UPI001C44C7C2|nr:tether containing UBX domain for GLUT4-like isoform X2 [Homarus americanus]